MIAVLVQTLAPIYSRMRDSFFSKEKRVVLIVAGLLFLISLPFLALHWIKKRQWSALKKSLSKQLRNSAERDTVILWFSVCKHLMTLPYRNLPRLKKAIDFVTWIDRHPEVIQQVKTIKIIIQMKTLPALIGKFQEATNLDIAGLKIERLSPEIGQLTQLTNADISRNHLVTLPSEISSLSSLTNLNLSWNQLVNLPAEIGQLKCLITLNLAHNCLEELPVELGGLSRLTNLNLSKNRLRIIPDEVSQLKQLITFDLSYNDLYELSSQIDKLVNLRDLNLHENPLQQLPKAFLSLSMECKITLTANSLGRLTLERFCGGGPQLIFISKIDFEL